MPAPCYVGDEVTAAGFRLAGLATIVPAAGGERAALDAARAQAPLVLLCAGVAAHIDVAALRDAVAAGDPPVAILPDTQGDARTPDIGARIARTLGLEG